MINDLVFALVIVGFAYLFEKVLMRLYQPPSKRKIEKWIKSQNWFVYYYDLHVVKDWKNAYIGISTVSNTYTHCIDFEEINKLQEFLKCESIKITENNKYRIFLKVNW